MNMKRLFAMTMAAMMLMSSVAMAEGVCTPSDLPMVTEAPAEAPAEPETLDVTVTVIWQDGSNAKGLRPEKVLVALNGSDGSSKLVEVKEEPPIGEPKDEADPFNRWRYTFYGMPKMAGDVEIAYTVEAEVPEGYRFEAIGLNAYLSLVETEETVKPTEVATAEPTMEPTVEPTAEPTMEPTIEPTAEPTAEPTVEPTVEPTMEPTAEPTAEPTVQPTAEPTIEPTAEPTVEPTVEPTMNPTAVPTEEPTEVPTVEPTMEPTVEPTMEPTTEPTAEPMKEPTEVLTETPTITPVPVITYERDENGQLMLDENGQPMAIVPEGMDIPVQYQRDEQGNLVLNEIGDPVPTQYVPAGSQFIQELKDKLNPNRRIDVYASWEGEELYYGDEMTLTAVLFGYENAVYTLQWQVSADAENWTDVEGETESVTKIIVTEDNYLNYWRIMVKITDATPVDA